MRNSREKWDFINKVRAGYTGMEPLKPMVKPKEKPGFKLRMGYQGMQAAYEDSLDQNLPKPINAKGQDDNPGVFEIAAMTFKGAANAVSGMLDIDPIFEETYPGERKEKARTDSHYFMHRPVLSAAQKQKPFDGTHIDGDNVRVIYDPHQGTNFSRGWQMPVNGLGTGFSSVQENAWELLNNGQTELVELPSKSADGYEGTVLAFATPETAKNIEREHPAIKRHWLTQRFSGSLETHENIRGVGPMRKQEIINRGAHAIHEAMQRLPDPKVVQAQHEQREKEIREKQDEGYRAPSSWF